MVLKELYRKIGYTDGKFEAYKALVIKVQARINKLNEDSLKNALDVNNQDDRELLKEILIEGNGCISDIRESLARLKIKAEDLFDSLMKNEEFIENLQNYMKNPTKESYFKKLFENLKFEPKFISTIINKIAIACTQSISVMASEKVFNNVVKYLESEKFISENSVSKEKSWFEKNKELTKIINEKLGDPNGDFDKIYRRARFLSRINEECIQQKSKATVCMSKEDYLQQYMNLLKMKPNLILAGPPGTGKTHLAKAIAEKLTNKNLIKLIQFHPAYSYEDFVRGIVAKLTSKGISYRVENKILGKLAEEAAEIKNRDKKYVLIIDEINRANLPAVLGELIYALEYRGKEKGEVESMYALEKKKNNKIYYDNKIFLPENLYIIGTMNTADRSVGQIDYAIRRRFVFDNVMPKELSEIELSKENKKFARILFKNVEKLFKKDKETAPIYLSKEFRSEDVQLGHSYFIIEGENDKQLMESCQKRLDYEIKPILMEYIKDGILNENAKKIIEELKANIK